MNNDRLDALNILMHVIRDKTTLSQQLPPNNAYSSLTKEICFGVCRHYIHLQSLADQYLDKRPKDLDVWILLLIGLYQLDFLNIPKYAVVQETVAITTTINKLWAKNFINAILRAYCRESTTNLMHYNHPAWLKKRIMRDWPEHWQNIFAENDKHPPMTLRVNIQKNTTTNYIKRLTENNIQAQEHPYAKEALILDKPCSVHELPGFSDGDVSVQDAAAQLAVSLLQLKPNLRVLDACCAPGGKLCHILETQVDLAECIGLDLEKQRLKRTEDNLNRLNLHASLIQGDATKPDTWWDGIAFDRILLDAPCSAIGVIRRHPDIKLLRSTEEINTIAELQYKILNALWPLLAIDGILVYATCSITNQENTQQIQRFITEHADALYIPQNLPWGYQTSYGQQILPGMDNMDGFFYSVIQKIKIAPTFERNI